MSKKSAGILLFRQPQGELEVLLIHPGGPIHASKDEGVWSIPKGEVEEGEDLLAAAQREFTEETGFSVEGDFIPLTPIRQPSGKIVYVWAVQGDVDPALLKSNLFTIEWPPKSQRHRQFPEADRASWFSIPEATKKILKGQTGFLLQLRQILSGSASAHPPEENNTGS
jgi:predicted NUDIX family NTP pyrophosphohydrolase